MTAEKAKLDLTNGAENLNTIQWGFYSLGSLFGDILAPFLLESLGGLDPREPDDNGYVPRSGARNATAACGILFAILACLGFLYEDKKPKKALAKPITQASGKPSLTEARPAFAYSPLFAFISRAQGSSGAVATVPFVWRSPCEEPHHSGWVCA